MRRPDVGLSGMTTEVAIIGAGVAGLSCARTLADRGVDVLVLERSRSVGGRCATRRIDGQPVDHGVAYLHGSDAAFWDALAAVEADALWGWPRRVSGDGSPCEPAAFEPRQRRVAFAEGVNAFPKSLARGLSIRRLTTVTGLAAGSDAWRIETSDGAALSAVKLVLALPAPQCLTLLGDLALDDRTLASVRALLGMLGSHPCLAVMAGYPPSTPAPDWDATFPADSSVLQTVVHDSAKRSQPQHRVLVAQARPCWSLLNQDRPKDQWAAAIVAELEAVVGAWAARPSWHQAHRWRLARADRGMELSQPLLFEPRTGRVVGLAGEVFSRGAGVEAAWLSGRRLAHRLLGEES